MIVSYPTLRPFIPPTLNKYIFSYDLLILDLLPNMLRNGTIIKLFLKHVLEQSVGVPRDYMFKEFDPIIKAQCSWKSNKLAFEKILNDQFGIIGNPKIYIVNQFNTGNDEYFFRDTDGSAEPKYFYKPNNTIPLDYDAFTTYYKNDLVFDTDNNKQYIALQPTVIANTPFSNTFYWGPVSLFYKITQNNTTYDFIVYCPTAYQSQNDILVALINLIKLAGTNYNIIYY